MSTSRTESDDLGTPPWGEVSRKAVFATTHWSVVLNARRGDAPQAEASLEKLCQTYWLPLYAYVRRRGYSEADAEDLTQGFFAWLLERHWLEQADQQRGRFRSFLLTSISYFLANEWDKSQAQKRGSGRVVSLPLSAADTSCRWEPADTVTPEQTFERRWAVTLLDEVMSRLCADYARQDKAQLFEELKPCLLGERSAQPYASLATKLGMTEGSVKVAVHRLRQRYRQVLREEIAHTLEKTEDIEEEMRHLFAVLARG
jgi:RNA polymerase sigma factor (sigma-70 family)